MGLYEFRLLDAAGKVNTIQQRECQTLEQAISVGITFMAEYHFVEVWFEAKPIIRMPRH